MLERLRPRLTYANVMSTLAVFAVLGGTAYAATKLPRNSVGANQIKKGAVRSSEVKNGALRLSDFRRGDRPTGLPGRQGPVGPAGAPGAPGAAGAGGTPDAYAEVRGSGVLESADPGFPAAARNVDQSDITRVADGIYCIEGLPFRPASAIASSSGLAADLPLGNNAVVSVAINRGNGLAQCPSSTVQARVISTRWTHTAAPAHDDHPFFVWFERGP